jgi:antitoxin VapB
MSALRAPLTKAPVRAIKDRYQSVGRKEVTMAEEGVAKIFQHGRSQAVRLPKAYRLPGSQVRVRKLGRGVLLEPMDPSPQDIRAIFEELDRLGGADFLPEGRPEQPPMPSARPIFET